MVEAIKEYFNYGKFGPPASLKEIEEVEKELGVKMPRVLKELYLSFDGFREGSGNAAYLYPLKCSNGESLLVRMTKFFWDEYAEYYPNLNFRNYVFFGSSIVDENWGINLNDGTIIAYHHHMEDEYEVLGTDILQVYINDQKRFDNY